MKVLLLDEPLSNLDAKLPGQMRDEWRALVERGVHVAHDQGELRTGARARAVPAGSLCGETLTLVNKYLHFATCHVDRTVKLSPDSATEYIRTRFSGLARPPDSRPEA